MIVACARGRHERRLAVGAPAEAGIVLEADQHRASSLRRRGRRDEDRERE